MEEIARVRLVELPQPDKIERPAEADDARSQYSSRAEEIKVPSDEPGGSAKKSEKPPAGEPGKTHQPQAPSAETPERGKLKAEPSPQAPPPQAAAQMSPAEIGPKELMAGRSAGRGIEPKASASLKARQKVARPKGDAAIQSRAKLEAGTSPRHEPKAGFESPETKMAPREEETTRGNAPTADGGPKAAATAEVDNWAGTGLEERRRRRSVAFMRDKVENKGGKGSVLNEGVGNSRHLPGLSGDALERYASAEGAGFGDPDAETVSLNTLDFKYFTYLTHVKERIEQTWRYPPEAGAQGLEGRLVMRFSIVEDGSLEGVTLLSSSGYSILDDEALRAVKDSSPFYPLPRKWGKKRLNINAVFIYRNFVRLIRLR